MYVDIAEHKLETQRPSTTTVATKPAKNTTATEQYAVAAGAKPAVPTPENMMKRKRKR